jgi:PIN domain nuclease of toxin-antitoxin system
MAIGLAWMQGAVAEDLPHGDPADRIVAATARSLGAKLLTADSILRDTIPFVLW